MTQEAARPAARGRGRGAARRGAGPAPTQPEIAQPETESSEESSVDEGEAATSTRPSGSMPISPRTEHVPEKTRRLIRKGEFVDFKDLIAHPRGEKQKKRFTIAQGYFEEVEDTTNLNFYSWLDAYVVLMSINLEFRPQENQGMLRHLQIVKNMHSNGKDGVEYDYQFRRLKSLHKDIVWGEFMAELAGQIKELRAPAKPQETAKTHTKWPAGSKSRVACNRFNSLAGCRYGPKCTFAHHCRKCYSRDHPVHRCSKKP